MIEQCQRNFFVIPSVYTCFTLLLVEATLRVFNNSSRILWLQTPSCGGCTKPACRHKPRDSSTSTWMPPKNHTTQLVDWPKPPLPVLGPQPHRRCLTLGELVDRLWAWWGPRARTADPP